MKGVVGRTGQENADDAQPQGEKPQRQEEGAGDFSPHNESFPRTARAPARPAYSPEAAARANGGRGFDFRRRRIRMEAFRPAHGALRPRRETRRDMATLGLRPSHKAVRTYYESLADFERLGVTRETAVRSAFQALLEFCAGKRKWTLAPEHPVSLRSGGARRRGRRAHRRLRPRPRLVGGEGRSRRPGRGGPAQVRGGLPARQHSLSDAPPRHPLAERPARPRQRSGRPEAADRGARGVLLLASAGDRRMGGGGRALQGQGARHRGAAWRGSSAGSGRAAAGSPPPSPAFSKNAGWR